MSQYTLKVSAERAKEMPMVDLAFEILKSANTPHYYRDLMQEIAKIKGISDDEIMQVIAQLYTEINIDGRFACVGNNLWGLKRWYPIDKQDDMTGGGTRPRIINDDDDDEDIYEDDQDEELDEDSFSDADEEDEDVYDDEEEEIDEDIDADLDEDIESEDEDFSDDMDESSEELDESEEED